MTLKDLIAFGLIPLAWLEGRGLSSLGVVTVCFMSVTFWDISLSITTL